MMHGLDSGARIVSVNEHWLTTLGYGRAEVVGRHVEEFLTASSAGPGCQHRGRASCNGWPAGSFTADGGEVGT